MTDTAERILDVAERLFAEQGLDGTSLRAITREAGVNLAAVHYHFGSKEGLLDALVARCAGEVGASRIAELERLSSRPDPADVPSLLRAYLEPALRTERLLLLARLVAHLRLERDGAFVNSWRRHFDEVDRLFEEQLGRALPQLEASEVAARFRLALACMHDGFDANASSSDLEAAKQSPDAVLERLIDFAAAGLRAGAEATRSGRSTTEPAHGKDAA